jgi:hypothetical protein
VRKVNKGELEKIQARGGKVHTMPKHVAMPGLEAVIAQFAALKKDAGERHDRHNAAMLERIDKLLEAIASIRLVPGKPQDLAPLIAAIGEMRQEHEPCDYKLTGKRDRRGFIDLEHGLTFTAVRDE